VTATSRRCASPIRLTFTTTFNEDLNGAWWPRTVSIATELADFIDALRDSLGEIVDIRVNWSPSDAIPDLDMLTRRGVSAIPGWKDRPQRVITVIGSQARANLLVVPNHTTSSLATMVLRHAAGMPIEARLYESAAYLAADDIVRNARAQCTRSTSTQIPGASTS
jgi:Family of unknown function (DUF5994)